MRQYSYSCKSIFKFQLRYILYKSDVLQKKKPIIVILALTVSCCQIEHLIENIKVNGIKPIKTVLKDQEVKNKLSRQTKSVYLGKMCLN